jgi:hypothetical protein
VSNNNGGPLPIVLCGNKTDIEKQERQVPPADQITWHRDRERAAYYEISAKAALNFEEPFLWLCRQFFEDESLVFLAFSFISLSVPFFLDLLNWGPDRNSSSPAVVSRRRIRTPKRMHKHGERWTLLRRCRFRMKIVAIDQSSLCLVQRA